MLKDLKAPPIFDVQLVLRLEWGDSSGKWLFHPFKINKAEPPRRKLDDIRAYLHLWKFGIAIIFAHYRGGTYKPTSFLDRAS